MATHAPPALLQIDDLVIYIFRCLSGRRDQVSLTLVSASIFHSLVPLLWETVAIDTLLALIPGVESISEVSVDIKPIKITLPSSPRECDLSRLHFYAPFVRNLDITRRARRIINITDDTRVQSLSPPGQKLLPNLLSLHVDRFGHNRRSTLRADWIYELVSSSVEHLFLNFDASRAELSQAARLDQDGFCNALIAHFPGLRTLHLMAAPDYKNRGVVGHPLARDSNLGYMSRLTTLRELTVSLDYIRGEGLNVAGRLPLLHSFGIVFSSSYSNLEHIPELSIKGAFPVLRRLSLLKLPSAGHLNRIWTFFDMVDGLDFLHIEHAFGYNTIDISDQPHEYYRSLTSIMRRDRSTIKSLSLRQCWRSLPLFNELNFLDFIASLSGATLEFLDCRVLGSCSFDIRHIPQNMQNTTLPFLRRLKLSNINIELNALPGLAKMMPSLEALAVYMYKVAITNQLDVFDALPRFGSPALRTFEVLDWDHSGDPEIMGIPFGFAGEPTTRKLPYTIEDCVNLAIFFASLWPNVQIRIAMNTTNKQSWSIQRLRMIRQATGFTELLNRHVSLLGRQSLEKGVSVRDLGVEYSGAFDGSWNKWLVFE